MKAFRFVHLNVHTHYSIMDGCASIRELVDAAIKDKMPGICIIRPIPVQISESYRPLHEG